MLNNSKKISNMSKIDPRGRIAFSPELRKIINAEIGDYVKIVEENGKLVIYKVNIVLTSGVEPKVQGAVVVVADDKGVRKINLDKRGKEK